MNLRYQLILFDFGLNQCLLISLYYLLFIPTLLHYLLLHPLIQPLQLLYLSERRRHLVPPVRLPGISPEGSLLELPMQPLLQLDPRVLLLIEEEFDALQPFHVLLHRVQKKFQFFDMLLVLEYLSFGFGELVSEIK